MRETVINKCQLLVENKETMSKVFFGQYDILNIAAACQLSCDDKKVDKEMVKRTNEILKSNTGVFSILRGFVKVPLVSDMLKSGEPEAFIEKVKKAYEVVEKNKVLKSDYYAFAAEILASHVEVGEYEKYNNKAIEIYEKMKKDHPFLTDKADYPFAVILAINGSDVDTLMVEAEKCYNILKPDVFSKDCLQSVSHVLALGAKPAEEKCERLLKLLDMLKAAGHKFGHYQELAVLAAAVILDIDDKEIVEDICAADDYLKGCKGFGNFMLGKTKRRMFAAQMALCADASENTATTSAAISTSIAITIAIEVCMIMIITASSIAANSSH